MTDTLTPVEVFHSQRRMFAVVKGRLHVAKAGDRRSHKVWFDHQGWRDEYGSATRGFYDETGLYVYTGGDLFMDGAFMLSELAEHIDMLELPPETPVFVGMKKGEPGTRWEPIAQKGTVLDLLGQYVGVPITVRISRDLLAQLNKALGDYGTKRLLRRAVGQGADDAVRKMFQSECRPHDLGPTLACVQSNTLQECARCGARVWD